MKRNAVLVVLAVFLASLTAREALAHCQIPCGIYDDPARFGLMAEHITTIEKSMKQIQELSAAGDKTYNQLVRWIDNKEQHADYFSDIVTQYFLTQRIKPASKSDPAAYADYVNKLTLLHQMMVTSMKCKQTTDLENVATLRSLLAEFRTAYLGK